MILVLFIPFAIAVGLNIVHEPNVAWNNELIGLVAEYRDAKTVTLSTLDEADEAGGDGNQRDTETLTSVLHQVSHLSNAIMSYYSKRREQSRRYSMNADDVPVIFLMLAGTRALEEAVKAELRHEQGDTSQAPTARQAGYEELLRLADEEMQKITELRDPS
jgi:hypothetical protein